MVFLQDPGTDPVVGITSVFEVQIPRRGFADWSNGVVDGYRLPVGCAELVIGLCGYSPNSRPSDQQLVSKVAARCDRQLLGEIERTALPYDKDSVWTRC